MEFEVGLVFLWPSSNCDIGANTIDLMAGDFKAVTGMTLASLPFFGNRFCSSFSFKCELHQAHSHYKSWRPK
jgi:hypothetical protein